MTAISIIIIILASVPALSCRCMTYIYLLKTAMSPKSLQLQLNACMQSTMATCSLLQLSLVNYGYLQSTYGYLQSTMATCMYTIWLPVVYYGYGYLQSTTYGYLYSLLSVIYYARLRVVYYMATCSVLWLPAVDTMPTCSPLMLPVVYYGYLQSVLATCSLQWLPAVYNGYSQSIMITCSLQWVPVVSIGQYTDNIVTPRY